MPSRLHTIEVAQLRRECTQLQGELDRLMDLRLGGELRKEDFEFKKHSLKERQYELAQMILVLTYQGTKNISS